MTGRFFSLFLFTAVLVVSCELQQEEDSSATILCVTSEASAITHTSAVLNGSASIKDAKAASANAYFYYFTNTGDAKTIKASGQRVSAGTIDNSGGDFSYNLSSLLPSTTYYYVASVAIDDVEVLGSVKTFTTEKKTDAISVTGAALNVTVNSATLTSYANIPADMSGDVTIGIIYSTNSSPSLQNGRLVTSKDLDGNNMYQVEVVDLTPDTKYYFKSFVSRGNLNYYGDVKEFSTALVLAGVTTIDAWDIADNRVSIGGKVEVSSTGTIRKEAAMYIGTDGSALEALKTKGKRIGIDIIAEDGSFSAEVKELTASTKYYYVAVVDVEGVEFCGTIKSFTTSDKAAIAVTGEYSDLGESSVKLYGWCNQEGTDGASVVYGIEYSDTDLTTAAITVKAEEKDSDDKFGCHITGLSSNTLYYYRVYVLFNGVRTYGEVKSFTTKEITANITSQHTVDSETGTVTLNGNLQLETVDDLDKSVWFVYSSSETELEGLIRDGQKISVTLNQDGSYSAALSLFFYNKTYYYVTCAQVYDKIFYSEVKSLIIEGEYYWLIHGLGPKGVKSIIYSDYTENYDRNGHLTSIMSQGYEETFTYSPEGLISEESRNTSDGYTYTVAYEYNNDGRFCPRPIGAGSIFHVFERGLLPGLSKVTFYDNESTTVMNYIFSGDRLTIRSAGPNVSGEIVFDYEGAYPKQAPRIDHEFLGPFTYQANGMFDTYIEGFYSWDENLPDFVTMNRTITVNKNFQTKMLPAREVSEYYNVGESSAWNIQTVTYTYNEHGDCTKEDSVNTAPGSGHYVTTHTYTYDSKGNWTKCETRMTSDEPGYEPLTWSAERTIVYY